MYYGFQGLIYTLQQWGIIDVILPFLLIFTIVFAVMEQTGILGGKKNPRNRKYSAILAMVMAFAVVVPHITGAYYYGFDAVVIINQALPQVALLLVAVVMMLLTIGLWTGKRADGSKGVGKWFTIASGIIVIIIFIGSLTRWTRLPRWLWWLLNTDVLALIVAVLVFGFIIKFIAADPEDPKSKESRRQARSKAWGDFLAGGDDDD